MNSMKGKLRSTLLVLGAAALLAAVGAAPASASIVNAKFSAGTIKLTTSGVTAKKNGTEAKSCTLSNGATTGTTSGSLTEFSNGGSLGPATVFLCPSPARLEWDTVYSVEAKYDTVTEKYFLEFWPNFTPVFQDPWGTGYHSSEIYKVPFTNGSGLTPSQLTASEAKLGRSLDNKTITMTGTFNVTTKEGGLLTLSH